MSPIQDINPFRKKKDEEQQDSSVTDINPFRNSSSLLINKPDVDDDLGNVGFFHALGDLVKYVGALNSADATLPEMAEWAKRQMAGLKAAGHNIGRTFQDLAYADRGLKVERDAEGKLANVRRQTHEEILAPARSGAEAVGSIGNLIANPWDVGVKGGGFSNLGQGLIKDFIEKPLSAFSATVNKEGVPVPATPIEQAHSIQHLVALGVSTAVGVSTAKALVPGVTGSQAIDFLSKSVIGNLSKTIGADIVGAAAGGAAYSSIADLGSEEYGGKIIGTTLSVMPLGVIFGLFHTNSLYKQAKDQKAKTIFLDSEEAANDIAAANALKITEADDLGSAAAKIQSVATSDDLLTAAVRSNLDLGIDFIVPNLSKEGLAAIKQQIDPPNSAKFGGWHPNADLAARLDKATSTVNGVLIEFLNDFDKAAYFARRGRTGAAANDILDDILSNTEATLPEVMSHGEAIKAYIDSQMKLVAEGKHEALKTGKIQVPPQMYKPDFARKTFDYNAYEGPDGAVWFSMGGMPDEVTNFFKETGFIQNELVTAPDGGMKIVRGGEGDLVRVKPIRGDKIETFHRSDLRRHSHSFDSQLHKVAGQNALQMGVLTPDSWFDRLYKSFKTYQIEMKSFAENFAGFVEKIGMTSKNDSELLAQGFYKRIQDELLDVVDNDTKIAFQSAQESLKEMVKERSKDAGAELYGLALSNEMYIKATGAGVYEIRSLADNTLFGTVNSISEAKGIINKAGQTRGPNLDGGNGNMIPPAAFAPSVSMQQPFSGTPVHWIDRRNVQFARNVPPIRNLAASADAIFKTKILSKVVEPLQVAQQFLKTFLVKDAAFLEAKYNATIKKAKQLKIKTEDTSRITDLIEIALTQQGPTPHTRYQLVNKWHQVDGLDLDRITNIAKVADDFIDYYKAGEARFGIGYELAKTLSYIGYVERDAFILGKGYAFTVAKEQRIIPKKAVDLLGHYQAMNPNLPENITFKEVEKLAKQALRSELQNTPDVPKSAMRRGFQEYLDAVHGIPAVDEGLYRAMKRLLGSSPIFDSANLSALWLTATQGGIPAYAVRDWLTGLGNVYTNYGVKFAGRFARQSIKPKYAQALMDASEIPNVEALHMLMPDEDILVGYSLMTKSADLAMKLSGQHAVYAWQSAALYKLTLDDAAAGFSKLLRNTAKKEEVYKDLHLSSLPSGLQQQLDDMITRGNAEGASKFLARWRVKQMLTAYGNYNNPIGWKGTYGRLLGQAGSWAANQVQTVADMTRGLNTKGTRAEAAGRLFRFAAFNAALIKAGGAAGFNLATWSTIPYINIGGPIINTFKEGVNALSDIASENESQTARGWATAKRFSPVSFDVYDATDPEEWTVKLDQWYIPYGRTAQNMLDGWKWFDLGEPVLGIGKAVGVPTSEKPY